MSLPDGPATGYNDGHQAGSRPAIGSGRRQRVSTCLPLPPTQGGSDGPATSLAPTLAPISDFSCISPSIPDNSPTPAHSGARRNSGGKWAKNTTNLESRLERAKGFEPSTSSLGSWHSTTELRPRVPKMLPAPGGGVNPFRRARSQWVWPRIPAGGSFRRGGPTWPPCLYCGYCPRPTETTAGRPHRAAPTKANGNSQKKQSHPSQFNPSP